MEFFEDGELLGEQDHHYGDHYVGLYENTGYRTIPKKDKSEKIWKRFAFLPNTDGQKYTIGNTFKSREEQGELIFWFDAGDEKTDYSKITPNSICEISVVKNKFWITPLMANRIYVNDVEIKASTRINFGEHIVFGARRKYWAKKREFFTERMSPLPDIPERSQWDKDSATSLGQNSLLVSLILSYIPLQNLKKYRLVSKVWNEEGIKLVKRKCQVHFTLGKGGDWGFDGSIKSMKLFQYSVDMKNCLLQNWKMTLPSLKSQGYYYTQDVDHSAGKPGAKLLADLERFLLPQNLGHSIRKLELGGKFVYAKDLDVRTKILESLKSTLQGLVLSGYWYDCRYPSEEDTFPIINFKKLKRFTLKVVKSGQITPHGETWLQSLIQSMQGVGALHFGRDCCETLITMFLQKNSFPNLEEIAFDETFPDVISFLLGLKKPLKKLELCRIQDMEVEDVANFKTLIQFHSNALESLLFDFPFIGDDSARIELPVMPKLKHLTVGLLSGNSDYGSFYGNRNKATFTFTESHHLNYSQHFPTLQSLTLRDINGNGHCGPVSEMDKFWEKNERYYAMFFPPDISQICGTLQHLNIPFEDENRCVFPRAAQVAGMFPNVSNPWINEARKKKGSAE